jgi:hypothetical protein
MSAGMKPEYSKYQELATIRSHYREAVTEACRIYYGAEEVAAYLVLEIFRLKNLKCTSEPEEEERQERLSEKKEILAQTKETMYFVLEKLHELARDRDKFISDIYTSAQIVDLESKLGDLAPWLKDLSTEVESRVKTAKLDAKVASEISRAKTFLVPSCKKGEFTL